MNHSFCRLYLTLILLPLVSGAFAQSIVKGFVTDQQGHPIAYATVMLMKTGDSSHLTSKLTAGSGQFVFNTIPQGSYFLKVSYASFEEGRSAPFRLEDRPDTVDIGTVQLAPKSTQLKALEVLGRKPLVEKKGDRFIMNVENNAITTGSSLDLLKEAPFVQVSSLGEVSLQNKKTMILLDNRVVPDATIQDILLSLPAGEISRIEFLTEPSARYDASYGAVINIITRKSQTYGTTGNLLLEGTPGTYNHYIAGGKLTYKSQKTISFLRFTYGNFHEWYYSQDNLHLQAPGQTNVLADSTVRLYHTQSYSFQAGSDLSLSRNQTLGFVVNARINQTPGSFNSATRFSLLKGPVDSILYSPSSFSNNGATFNYNINYHLIADSGKSDLQALVTFTPVHRTIRQSFIPYITIPANDSLLFPVPYKTINPSRVNIFIEEADFTHQFSHQWKLESGIKFQQSTTRNDIMQDTLANGQYAPDAQYSSNTRLTEEIYGVYGILSGSWTSYSLRAGLRNETTSASSAGYFSKQYTDFFPDLSLERTLPNKMRLSLTYRRQISRPPYQEILPYTIYLNQYTIFQGNPLLNPSYDNVVSLNTSVRKLDITISYTETSGAFYRLPYNVDPATEVTIYSFQNLRHSDTYSTNLFYPLTLTRWWTTTNSADADYNRVSGPVLGNVFTREYGRFDLKTDHTVRMTDWVKLKLTYAWYSSSYQGLTKLGAYNFLNAGLLVSLWKEKGQINLSGDEILNRITYHLSKNFGTFDQSTSSTSNSRRITLNFTYKFGKTKVAAPQKNLGSQDALQRVN